MRISIIAVVCGCLPALSVMADDSPDAGARYWAQWRGPLMTGAAPHGDPPVEWSESKNIRWKVELPGLGHATPIVWGDRIYVQTAVKTDQEVEPEKPKEQPAEPGDRRGGRRGNWMRSETPSHIHQFTLLSLDRQTGKTIWQRTLREALPHEGGHQDASQASNSPATDGKHIIAHFGSRGVYCLDMDGQLVWQKDLGAMQTRRGFGEGSSPALFGDTVVINWDHEGESFIVALDKSTGEQQWRIERDEPTSWATPLVIDVGGKPQVVTSAANRIRSYDLRTGDLRWQCGGMTMNVIPSPVKGDGLLYFASGFRGSALIAVRYADAAGDITDSESVAWVHQGKGTPYVPSTLLYEDTLYFLDANHAILSCVDAKTGVPRYTKQRLEGLQGVFASPVAANGRVYVAGRGGRTAVIKSGPEFKLLATNTLDEGFTASPVVVGGEILLRSRNHLYCIARD